MTFIVFLHESYAREMQVSPIQANDRLPSTTVNRIFQDKEGYIWIGTPEGLCRYDGYRILNIKPIPINNNQGSNNVISIQETGEFLLIGTDKGLRLLNKKTCQTSYFPGKELGSRKINSILVDRNQDIWVGTDGPVFVYHPDLTLKKVYRTRSSGGPLPTGGINFIYEDRSGTVWLCFWEQGLYKYDKKANSFVAFPRVGINNNPFKIFEDNKKNYWICTWGGGLFLFHPDDKRKMYTEIPVRSKRRKLEKEQLFYNVVQDSHFGYIWVMSFSGITAFEYTPAGRIREKDVSNLFENTNNIFTDLCKDSDGNLWMAAFGNGILNINFNKPSIQNRSFNFIKNKYDISAIFTMLYEDSGGQMWFNMDRLGPGTFDPHTGQTDLYGNQPELAGLVALRAVSCAIQPSGSEEVWLGSTNSPVITVFKRKQGLSAIMRTIDLRRYYTAAGNPRGFFEDSRNNLWISTTKGLFVKRFNQVGIRPVITIPDNISGITEDKQGNIWIASAKNGLYKLTMPSNKAFFPLKIIHFRKIKGITDSEIRDITADRRGNIWIASASEKISYYNIDRRKFSIYSQAAAIKEGILDMVCDKNGYIWVSTSRQIFRILPFKSVTEYSAEDGLTVNIFMKKAYTESHTDNKIYFGGNNGICAFNTLPDRLIKGDKHKVHITDIKINNESVLDNPKREYPFETGRLILEHDDENLEIDFSSLNYEFPNKIRYAYKLEGVDGAWIYPDKGRRFAVYNNLRKGEYTFLVKATGPDNIWHNAPIKLSIYKKPVFYETNIAYLIYTAIVAVLVYAWFRFTAYRLKLRSDLRIAQIEREKTEDLAQTKISYFTGISHDFLTPLTIISCLIDDIQITTKRNLPQYEKMRSNVNRLKRLLQQILDFRRIESGNMQLKISRGDIVGFIRELCDNHFMPLAERKHINFMIGSSFSEPTAYFDADKIDKVFFNILSNAFKYTPEGGQIHVQLDLERYKLNDFLVAKISDTGIGIPQEELGKIFTPFYNNPTARIESNGIGLSLTKNLVEIHHGSIEVESSLNYGTSFTVKIPVNAESYNENELKNVAEIISEESNLAPFPQEKGIKEEAPRENEEVSKLNLLLVDDNEDLLGIVENILKEYYNVHCARNGVEALNIVNKTEIDIIVSDVMMPEMDGLQLCRKLKNDINTSHIPVILLTAKNSVDDRVECYNAGADAYISKPFELKVLVARISNFIAQKKNRQSGFKSSYEINLSALDNPSMDEEFLKKTIETIEKHLTETDFDVVALAGYLNISRSTLYRKIKGLVGLPPNEFIKNIRLKHACQIMSKDKSISVSEVAFSTGFSDPRYFATCFKAEFGITPSEYQKGNGSVTS